MFSIVLGFFPLLGASVLFDFLSLFLTYFFRYLVFSVFLSSPVGTPFLLVLSSFYGHGVPLLLPGLSFSFCDPRPFFFCFLLFPTSFFLLATLLLSLVSSLDEISRLLFPDSPGYCFLHFIFFFLPLFARSSSSTMSLTYLLGAIFFHFLQESSFQILLCLSSLIFSPLPFWSPFFFFTALNFTYSSLEVRAVDLASLISFFRSYSFFSIVTLPSLFSWRGISPTSSFFHLTFFL